MSGLAAVAALALTLLSIAPEPALAHEVVVSTSPADGAQMNVAPAAVSVTFSGPVEEPTALSVTNDRGEQVEEGPPIRSADSRTINVPLKPGSGTGSYLVEFATTGEDGHPVQGTFDFVVGDGAP